MSGVNKVILIGRLGNDPECRNTTNGGMVANISLATSEKWLDKKTNQQKEKTEWHRVVIFGKLAEVASNYLHKGSNIYIEGKLQTRKWQDQGGQDKYTTEIVANSMQMLDSKGNDNLQQSQSSAETVPNFTPAGQYKQAQLPVDARALPPTHQQVPKYSGGSGRNFEHDPMPMTVEPDFEDDIPF